MSRYISDLNVAEYDKLVKQEYAQKAQLRDTVRVKTGVVGESCRFQKSAQGLANKKVPQADVTPMNIDYSHVTAILEDWNAPDYTDIFSAPKVNFSEKQELASLSAQAINRREDQLIIDSATIGATELTVASSIGGNTLMNTAKFTDAKRQLDYYSVPASDRVFVMSSEALYDLLGQEEPTSADYNMIKSLVNGEITKWLGFKILTVGFMAEGGLPKTGTERSAFAYHKSSTGHAVGMNMASHIDWVPTKTSWLVNTTFSAGTITIDPFGMVTIKHDEQSA